MPGGLLKLCVRLLPIFIAQCKGRPPLPGGLLKLGVRLLPIVQLSVRIRTMANPMTAYFTYAHAKRTLDSRSSFSPTLRLLLLYLQFGALTSTCVCLIYA